MKKFLAAVLLFPLALALPLQAAEQPLRVVASFSILGDMVKEIGGKAVEVKVLAGPNTDMHTFQPTPEDSKAIANADLIAINGLGLDRWMKRLFEPSGTRAKLLVASAGVKPRILGKGDSAVVDPHAWQNLAFGRIYARNIAGALMNARPEHAAEIRERFKRYDSELKEMDKYVREQFAAIPPERRKVITTHDAFGYFGDAYGVTFLSPLGMSTEAEASAFDVAKLIGQIKAEGVKAVFIENMSDPRLMEQIANEAGARMGGELYSDALSKPDGPAPTYLDMFRVNATKLRKGMAGNQP